MNARPLLRQTIRLWIAGLWRPRAAFDEIATVPGIRLGAAAVLIRFGVTAITELLPLARLHRQPFHAPRLALGRSRTYDARDVAILPAFGFGVWCLMSAVAWATLRLAGRTARVAPILNIVGMGMLIPMPLLWLWDWRAISRDRWQPVPMASSHALVEVWEGTLFAIGLTRMVGLRPLPATVLGQALGTVYVIAARLVVR